MALPGELILWTTAAFTVGILCGVSLRPRRRVSEGAGRPVEAPGAVRSGSFVALAGALTATVLVLDGDDRLVFFNEAAKRSAGLDEDSLGMDSAVAVRSADFLERLRRVRAGDFASKGVPVALRRGGIGSELLFDAVFAPLPVSAGFGEGALAVVMYDVTRLKRLEGMRREFVSNVSHDLRTPVTIVKGYANMLVEDYAEMADEDRLRFLEKIQRNSARLHALLEDLLVLSALEDGVTWFKTEPGVLHESIRGVADMLSDRMASARIRMTLDLAADDTRVRVDGPKMARVIQNLLDNVLRYGAGVATSVSISTSMTEGMLVLRVEDDGAGIAPAEYEKVFERFYRAEKSRSVAGGGSGIGLSIVKHLVLGHGGTVRAEPVRPRGFSVVISLPCIEEPVPESAGAA